MKNFIKYNLKLIFVFLVISCSHGIKRTPQSNPIKGDNPQNSADSNYQSTVLFESENNSISIDGPVMDIDGNKFIANVNQKGWISVKRSNDKVFIDLLKLPDNGVASSMRIGKDKKIFLNDYINHRIYTFDYSNLNPSLELFYENKSLNQPNDMALAKDGSIYFSDPYWNKKEKKGAIYQLTKDKNLKVIFKDLRTPNGIDLSPDETKLYFTDSISGDLFVADLNKLNEGELPSVLFEFKEDTVDGIRTDVDGNIYVTRISLGQIDKISPEGILVQSYKLHGEFPTNLSFGGPEGKDLLISNRTNSRLEIIPIGIVGREWQIVH